MKKYYFITISFILFYIISVGRYIAPPRLPVYILYVKNIPPDSIQTFVDLFIKSRKIKTVTQGELTELFANETNSKAMALLNSDKLNTRELNKLADNLTPLANSLGIEIFNSKNADTSKYIIDSIRWRVGVIPIKDTTRIKKFMFIPDGDNTESPYPILKSFLEKVLSSGYIN